MEENMFFGASKIIFENAKELRKNMTHAEKILWNHLKVKPNGYKFRRQHPLGIYIADFYCHKLKLVIEIDGSIHDNDEVKLNDEDQSNVHQGERILLPNEIKRLLHKGLTKSPFRRFRGCIITLIPGTHNFP